MNPNTMTVDECRSWLALDIHHRHLDSLGSKASVEDYYHDQEPVPNTLDAAVAAMPDVWQLTLEQHSQDAWEASAMRMDIEGPNNIRASHGETPNEAVFRLAVACRLKMKESK